MRVSTHAARWIVAGFFVAPILFTPGGVLAQGCEPIRFIVPLNLGGQGDTYQASREWRLTMAYRKLHSGDFFVGTESSPTSGPGGEPSVFDIHTLVGDVAYSISDRVRLRLSIPFSTGTISRKGWADGQRHKQTATGIGDIGLSGEMWVFDPKTHEDGNFSIGFGIKAPTGSHTKESRFYTANGSVAFPADQTVQPGDGGWGYTLQLQTFKRVAEGLYLYGFGSYMANPRAETEVTQSPTSTRRWSVPDVYSARLGASYSLLPDQGLSVSLGGRMDGIPKNDLLGGGDTTTIKRTSRIVYLDPGMSLSRGTNTFTLSIPIRLHVNRIKSGLEERTASGPGSVNGGGFAKYLFFASVSRRI
jgi:hypothetical protein